MLRIRLWSWASAHLACWWKTILVWASASPPTVRRDKKCHFLLMENMKTARKLKLSNSLYWTVLCGSVSGGADTRRWNSRVTPPTSVLLRHHTDRPPSKLLSLPFRTSTRPGAPEPSPSPNTWESAAIRPRSNHFRTAVNVSVKLCVTCYCFLSCHGVHGNGSRRDGDVCPESCDSLRRDSFLL